MNLTTAQKRKLLDFALSILLERLQQKESVQVASLSKIRKTKIKPLKAPKSLAQRKAQSQRMKAYWRKRKKSS